MIIEQRASLILFNVISSLENKNKIFLLPANTCPIVVLTYIKAGIKYELIDIDPESLCLDEKIVLKKLSMYPNIYGGVHYIHTYGVEGNQDLFFQNIKLIDSSIFIIDDKCLNIPKFRDHTALDCVDLEFFSTGYSKYIDIGWGGFGYLHEKFRYCKKDLQYEPRDLRQLTTNLQYSLINQTILNYSDSCWLGDTSFVANEEQYRNKILDKFNGIKKHKDTLNTIYSQGLPERIQLPATYQNWRFNIIVPSRNILLKKIFREGLFASAHYASVTHMFGRPIANYAEKSNANILNLFNDLRFDVSMAEKIVWIVKKHLKG